MTFKATATRSWTRLLAMAQQISLSLERGARQALPLREGRMSTYPLWRNVARRVLEAAIGDEHPDHGNDVFRCKEAVV